MTKHRAGEPVGPGDVSLADQIDVQTILDRDEAFARVENPNVPSKFVDEVTADALALRTDNVGPSAVTSADPGTALEGSGAIKSAASRGAITSLGSRWIRTVLQLGSSVILARLLTPADFGIIALMTVVTGLANLFQDLGLTTSVVRAREVSERQQATIFWVNVAFGFALTAALFLGAPLLADVYHTPQLANVARALSPTFTISALTGQARATLQRQLRFSVLSASEVVIGVAYLIGALVFALLGFGYWSLVGATLISSGTWAVMLQVRSPFRLVRPAPLREVRTLLKHGAQITGVQIATYFSRTLDVIVIGRFFGARPVGLYNRASQVVSLAENQITAAVTSVSLPVLSRLQDDPRRFNAFLRRAVVALGLTLVPIFFMLSLAAEPLVRIIYGPQWTAAGKLLVVLALAGTVRSLLLLIELAATALAVMGRQLVMTVATQAVTVVFLVIAAQHSLMAVAQVYVVATVVAVVIGSIWVSAGTNIDIVSAARAFLRPMLVCSAAYVVARFVAARTDGLASVHGALLALAVDLLAMAALSFVVPGTRADIRSVIQIVTSARGGGRGGRARSSK